MARGRSAVDAKLIGHEAEVLQAWNETMGHAGAIACHAKDVRERGADPRSDGAIAAF